MISRAYFPSKTQLKNLINKSTSLSQLTQTHTQLLINGFHYDLAIVTGLTQKLCDFNAMRYAHSLFLSIEKPDLFLYNALMKGFSSNKMHKDSILLYTHLRKNTQLQPNNYTFVSLASAASGFCDERIGFSMHAQAIVNAIELDLYFGGALVDFYFKVWHPESAKKVFDEIPKRDTVLWNTMVSGFVKNCYFEDSVEVFRDMFASGECKLDATTLLNVLPALAELQDLRLGIGIQCLAIKFGFFKHDFVLTGLISLYSKCGEIESAKLLFEEIDRPDLIAFNAMISGYTCNGKSEGAVKLLTKMLASGQKVNSSTIVSLIPVHRPVGHLLLTNCIHGFSVKYGVVSHPSVSTALITVYTRLNEIECARLLFDESPEKSLASWNAMISGCTQTGLTEMAISLFREMQVSEVNPNPVTVTSILSACAQLGSLSLGKWVHNLVKTNKIKSNIFLTTALIDMYAKCGSIVEARRLFDITPEKNEVTWNVMICGYGLHGQGHEALTIFKDMLNSGIHPTKVTFLSVLYACSHAGLVQEGDEIFSSMVRDYKLEPITEHYACMVDILGRAGQLEKALEFINRMPVGPQPAMWSTLLGACKIHKNTEIARVASERLFELESDNVGHYVLLSNIYSAERNYSEAASVRQVVKTKKLEKTPGCTLIEINETPYVFKSGDRSHPLTAEIYAKLDKLTAKMKEAGFQTETVTALHDVEEEEKELMVKVHSEKLAIAFGLISTEPGTEIRIIKNLRVCLDCHTATKFISKLTNRVIVVRDANRFHHFKDGECSCGDYW
ncbi:hypothetical protein ACFE04_009783 [Oxalis oulophora]